MAGTGVVGSALRRARELRGITVDEASRDTRLSPQQVEALETEAYEELGGEVYVRASSGNYQQWQISSAGGSQPRWRADGKELFYLARDGNVMSAAIEVSPVFRPGTPKALFKLPTTPDRDTPVFEDVTPDGQRVILNVPVTELSSVGFDVILNWSELLKTKE